MLISNVGEVGMAVGNVLWVGEVGMLSVGDAWIGVVVRVVVFGVGG